MVLLPYRGVQPTACRLYAAQDGYNVAQHKIINLFKTFFCAHHFFVSVCVLNVQPKTTFLLPVWPRDAKRLDTPAGRKMDSGQAKYFNCRNLHKPREEQRQESQRGSWGVFTIPSSILCCWSIESQVRRGGDTVGWRYRL